MRERSFLFPAWVLFAVAMLGFCGLRLWQNDRRWAALRDFKVEEARLLAELDACRDAFGAFMRTHPNQTATRADVEAAFNGGRPMPTLPGGLSLSWKGPSGKQANLRIDFEDGHPVGISGTNTIPASPVITRLDRVTEEICSSFYRVYLPLYLSWGVLLAVSIAWSRGRTTSQHLMLALAIIATALPLVAPRVAWEPRMLLNEPTVGMILASASVLALQVARILARRGQRFPMCARCGYNLTGNVTGVCPECGVAVGLAGASGGL